MRNPVVEFSQVSRCLLCHDAPCTRVCPGTDPARILRALRFENDLGAAQLLPDDDICSTCGSVCVTTCPTKTPIPEILSVLRERAAQMEEAPGAESVDLSCEICGVHWKTHSCSLPPWWPATTKCVPGLLKWAGRVLPIRPSA